MMTDKDGKGRVQESAAKLDSKMATQVLEKWAAIKKKHCSEEPSDDPDEIGRFLESLHDGYDEAI
eukprot:7555466-Pyramimonas_sp.AAC.1